MAYCKRTDPGSVNRWKNNVSSAMRSLAVMRTCPACSRGNAMGRRLIFPGGSARICRYCGHEKVRLD